MRLVLFVYFALSVSVQNVDYKTIGADGKVSPNPHATWYLGYKNTCSSSEPWRDVLTNYTAFHSATLAVLRRGNASEIAALKPAPSLSVYRVPGRRSIIGLGCLLPGLANVFLSAIRRGRIFLLDWPGMESVFEDPPGLQVRAGDWEVLAAALGPARKEAHYVGFAQGYNSAPEIRGKRAPELWGPIPSHDPVQLETHWIFNRGVYTQMGVKTEEEAVWVDSLIPRLHAASGDTLAWGCIYASVVPLTPLILARAGQDVLLPAFEDPPALPPKMPPVTRHRRGASGGRPTPAGSTDTLAAGGRGAIRAPPYVCLHIRTWALEPVPTESPPSSSSFVAAGFRCADYVLGRLASQAPRNQSDNVVLYVASDDVEVRRMARDKWGGKHSVITDSATPVHVAYLDETLENVKAREAVESSWSEWARLSRCPVLITSAFSGYGRSAGAAGWGSTLYFYDEDAAAERLGVEVEVRGGGAPCWGRQRGSDRELTKGFGAGW